MGVKRVRRVVLQWEGASWEPRVSFVIEWWNEKMCTGKVKIVTDGEGMVKRLH